MASSYDTIVLGIPWSFTISLKNKLAMLEASSTLWHGMKCAILENLSTTTKIKSLPLLDLGNPKTKSIETSSQGTLGIGRGVYKPWGLNLDFTLWHTMHFPTSFSTSQCILSQKKCLFRTPRVLAMPKYPMRSPEYASFNSNSHKEHLGMQSLSMWNKKPSCKKNFTTKKKKTYCNRNLMIDKYLLVKKSNYKRYLSVAINCLIPTDILPKNISVSKKE